MTLDEIREHARAEMARAKELTRLLEFIGTFTEAVGRPVDVTADAEGWVALRLDASDLLPFSVGVPEGAERRVAPAWTMPTTVSGPSDGLLVGTASAEVVLDEIDFVPVAVAPAVSQEISDTGLAGDAAFVTGPFTDAERLIVDEMVAAGADVPEIAARLNRQGGPVATLVRHARKRLADAASAQEPAPVAAPEKAPATVKPVDKVAPAASAPPFAERSAADVIASDWDAHIAAVPETVLFTRALDLDLMESLSAGLKAGDFAATRELTKAEVVNRFAALMGGYDRTMENQQRCIAALRRALGQAAA